MSQETAVIEAHVRERVGSRYSQRLRKQGRLPAVIYGHKANPVAVSIDEKEILTHLHHGVHVVNVVVDGAKTETCLVKDLQFGYLGDNVIHVDFARVDLDEEVNVNVALHFVGEPAEAQKTGAILTHDLTELTVICKVNAIPEEIKIDLSEMGASFNIRDLVLQPGVRTTVDPDQPVAHISYVHAEEAAGEEAEVLADATGEPEVLTEAKPKDESEGGD